MYIRGGNFIVIAVLTITVVVLATLLIFNGTGGSKDNNAGATVAATAATTATTATTGPAPAPTSTNSTTTGSTTTATTTTGQAPGNPQASVGSCIDLWNQGNNRLNQTFLVNLFTRQPVVVHVGVTSDVPPKCLVTVVANNGDAYVFPEGGGSTYPYAQVPAATPGKQLPVAQKVSNALEQSDGSLKAR